MGLQSHERGMHEDEGLLAPEVFGTKGVQVPRISPETRRTMLYSWALGVVILGAAIGPLLWRSQQVGFLIANLLILPALLALFPMVVELKRARVAKRTEEQIAWRAAYKASAASHHLDLVGRDQKPATESRS